MSSLSNPSLKGHKVLILIGGNPGEVFVKKLNAKFSDLQIDWHNTRHSESPVPVELYKDATVILTWDALPTAEQAPKLEIVQLTSAGSNHCWNSPLYANPKIRFCTANGVHPPQITEWIFATYLSFQHRMPRYIEAMQNCYWDGTAAGAGGADIEDAVRQRMGILGYGAIGRQCARAAKAFGMDVVAYTMRERSTAETRFDDSYVVAGTGDPEGLLPSKWFHGTAKESLNEFLDQDLDILVISLPLTSLTRNMIAKEQFQILSKKKTFLSNIGRGPIVNTGNMIEALEKGMIRGAALDVTDPEPLPKDHPLWKAPNVVITPHVSFQSTRRGQRVLDILECNLQRLSEGGPLVNIVDKDLGF